MLACDVQHRPLAAAFPQETVVELLTEILSFRDVRISRLHLKLPDTVLPWRGRVIRPGDGVRRVEMLPEADVVVEVGVTPYSSIER